MPALVVDIDPQNVRLFARDGYSARYGDAEDPEFLASLPLDRSAWVVSTLRDRVLDPALIRALRHQEYPGQVAVASSNRLDAKMLEGEGVDMVLIPYSDAAREAADRLYPRARPGFSQLSEPTA